MNNILTEKEHDVDEISIMYDGGNLKDDEIEVKKDLSEKDLNIILMLKEEFLNNLPSIFDKSFINIEITFSKITLHIDKVKLHLCGEMIVDLWNMNEINVITQAFYCVIPEFKLLSNNLKEEV